MRIGPLVYISVVVLAVFILPADTFANNGNSPEEVLPQGDSQKEIVNPVAEEASEQGEQTSEVAKGISEHGKQISQETTGKENQLERESEHAEPAPKNNVSTTLPPQASDQASKQTDKLEREIASKKETETKKPVKDESHVKKGRSKSSVEKSSKHNEGQTTQTNTQNEHEPADEIKDLQPVKPKKATDGKEGLRTSITDSGEKSVQKDDIRKTLSNDKNFDEREQREEPLSNPQPQEGPIAQIHRINPSLSPSPVSASGGDFGGQISFSVMIKGNLPGSFKLFASESQIIGMKTEFLRDQWVNAPPAEPPKDAS